MLYLPCNRRLHALHQLYEDKSESRWQLVEIAKVMHRISLPFQQIIIDVDILLDVY